jgi:hypothetical protein
MGFSPPFRFVLDETLFKKPKIKACQKFDFLLCCLGAVQKFLKNRAGTEIRPYRG